MQSRHGFDATLERLENAIEANKMSLVAQASASRGAVRMLAASVPAGIEAPLRLYVTEDTAGKTSITWRTPSAVFKPYASSALDALARELDPIVDKIVRDAI